MDHCDECGFTYDEAAISRGAGLAGASGGAGVAATLRALATEHVKVLRAPGQEQPKVEQRVLSRPAPDVWSALEYTCHVRDVLLIQRDRVILALVEDTPSFPRMYRDERVVLAGYSEERPGEVAAELVMAADLAGRVFERLSVEQVERRCIYNFPAPHERSVAWLGLHTVHEATHHLGDVRSVLARVTS